MQEKKSYIKQKPNTMHLYPKSTVLIFTFFILIFFELYGGFTYADEIIGILEIGLVFLYITKISTRDILTLTFLAVVVIIGLLSNVIYELTSSTFSVLLDVLTEVKVILSFFAIKYALTDKERQKAIDMIQPIARLFFISTFITSIISQFTDIGMSHSERYGLQSYSFVFSMAHQYTSVCILMLSLIVFTKKMSERKKIIYYFMAIVSLLMSLKGPPIMFSIMFVLMSVYFRRYNKLHISFAIPLLVILLLAGTYQINEYILKEDTPRNTFIVFGIRTANDFFPLGSGFSTFGSAEASKHYSPLYFKYGFDKMWGMSPEYGPFLSDTYWPMALGQFGWFGFALMIVVYVRIFMMISASKADKTKKAFLYAAYFQYIIHAFGSSIFASSPGLIGCMAIALCIFPDPEAEKANKKKLKIRFKI